MTDYDRHIRRLHLDLATPDEIRLAFDEITYHLANLDADGDALLTLEA